MLQDAKLWLMDFSGLSKDALHVYVGLTVFFGSALILRWRIAGFRPLLAVCIAALIGELWDMYDRFEAGSAQNFAGNWHDIWNTVFWPLVIFLLARFTPVVRR